METRMSITHISMCNIVNHSIFDENTMHRSRTLYVGSPSNILRVETDDGINYVGVVEIHKNEYIFFGAEFDPYYFPPSENKFENINIKYLSHFIKSRETENNFFGLKRDNWHRFKLDKDDK